MLITSIIQKDLVAASISPAEIMVRHQGRQNYGKEKILAKLVAGTVPAEPAHLVIRTDTMEKFGINVVLDDGCGNQKPMPTFETDTSPYTVTEFCSECETEVEMSWNPKVSGFAAFCPYCGKRLMLCDACRHADEYDAGDPTVNCDQDKDGCCRTRK